MMVFILHSVNRTYHTCWFAYIELSPVSRDNPSNFSVFLRIFVCIFIKDISLFISGFDYHLIIVSENKLGNILPSLIFWNRFGGVLEKSVLALFNMRVRIQLWCCKFLCFPFLGGYRLLHTLIIRRFRFIIPPQYSIDTRLGGSSAGEQNRWPVIANSLPVAQDSCSISLTWAYVMIQSCSFC